MPQDAVSGSLNNRTTVPPAFQPPPNSRDLRDRISEQITNDRLAKELVLGGLAFYPGIVGQLVYNDNIYAQPRKPVSDLIGTVQPSLLIAGGDKAPMAEARQMNASMPGLEPGNYVITDPEGWPGTVATLGYVPTFNWFLQNPKNDCMDQSIALHVFHPLAKSILGFEQSYASRTFPVFEVGSRSKQNTVNTSVTAGYRISQKSSVDFAFQRAEVNYSNSRMLSGYTEWNARGWYNYQVTEKFNLSVGLDFGFVEIPGQHSQTYEQLLVRGRYSPSQLFAAEVTVGTEVRQTGSAGTPANPICAVGLRYIPWERGNFLLMIDRRAQTSVYSGLNSTDTGATLGFTQLIRDRYDAQLQGRYVYREYQSYSTARTITPSDETITLSFALNAKITKHFRAGTFYQYLIWMPSQHNGMKNHQIGFRVQWNY